MIKFIPHLFLLPGEIGLESAEKLIHNQSNKTLSKILNDRLGDEFCTAHPDFETSIAVNVANPGTFLKIQTFCCGIFKQQLEVIVKNGDPFSEMENSKR
jgi:hypothetical protein